MLEGGGGAMFDVRLLATQADGCVCVCMRNGRGAVDY